jgi:hypothetical protein
VEKEIDLSNQWGKLIKVKVAVRNRMLACGFSSGAGAYRKEFKMFFLALMHYIYA